MSREKTFVAGLDVGTECVKAIVMNGEGAILGRTVVPTRGYFQERGKAALDRALDEAQLTESGLAALSVTGFGARCIPNATSTHGDAICHARGAYHHFPEAMTVIDIGGRDPQLIQMDELGQMQDIFTVRRCAVGIGSFLMFTARHLDVHPTRLEELASAVDTPAPVGSYCSVFAASDILDRLREGSSREEVALGAMHSIAARILEIGGLQPPVRITGGVVEYFPGVMKALAAQSKVEATALPEPIMTGAIGAALLALQKLESEIEASS